LDSQFSDIIDPLLEFLDTFLHQALAVLRAPLFRTVCYLVNTFVFTLALILSATFLFLVEAERPFVFGLLIGQSLLSLNFSTIIHCWWANGDIFRWRDLRQIPARISRFKHDQILLKG
jgi:hypothetical protein